MPQTGFDQEGEHHLDEKLQTLFAEVLRLPAAEITDALAMKDLEAWDSLKHIELIASIEATFGFELTFDQIVEMRSVGDIKRVLTERGVNS